MAALIMIPVCTQGDDYVDWVGMSLYHFGTTFPYDQNVLPEAQKFTSTVSLLLAYWRHALHALFGISTHTLSCCCCPCLTSLHRTCLTQWNDSVQTLQHAVHALLQNFQMHCSEPASLGSSFA